MIHAPLLNIARITARLEAGRPVDRQDLDSIWNDMNEAVCFFLRLQERGALQGHDAIAEEIRRFLNSRDDAPEQPVVAQAPTAPPLPCYAIAQVYVRVGASSYCRPERCIVWQVFGDSCLVTNADRNPDSCSVRPLCELTFEANIAPDPIAKEKV